MPWIESHQELERHPKTLDLMNLMGWDIDITIGKLHRFWWWCVDYAEDGDLRKHNDNRLSAAVGVLPSASKQFMLAMVQSGWIDREPYFRVHDWWHYFGEFLKAKYKNYPERWQAVRDLYSEENKTPPKTPPKPVLPNLTKPNQTNKAKAGEKQPVPVENLILKNLLKEVYKSGFNIYQLIGKFKREAKRKRLLMFGEDYKIPDEILIEVAQSYLKNKCGIKGDPFPWIISAMSKASSSWWVKKQDVENLKIKIDTGASRGGEIESLQDILKKMLPVSKIAQ